MPSQKLEENGHLLVQPYGTAKTTVLTFLDNEWPFTNALTPENPADAPESINAQLKYIEKWALVVLDVARRPSSDNRIIEKPDGGDDSEVRVAERILQQIQPVREMLQLLRASRSHGTAAESDRTVNCDLTLIRGCNAIYQLGVLTEQVCWKFGYAKMMHARRKNKSQFQKSREKGGRIANSAKNDRVVAVCAELQILIDKTPSLSQSSCRQQAEALHKHLRQLPLEKTKRIRVPPTKDQVKAALENDESIPLGKLPTKGTLERYLGAAVRTGK